MACPVAAELGNGHDLVWSVSSWIILGQMGQADERPEGSHGPGGGTSKLKKEKQVTTLSNRVRLGGEKLRLARQIT